MGARPRVRDWLGGRGPTTDTVDYDSLFRSRDFLDYLYEAIGSIETVIEPAKLAGGSGSVCCFQTPELRPDPLPTWQLWSPGWKR